ncbi:MAG: 1-(5-phosphoribosyl)-5-[(5-phosphoribosylamino)methylideneamino]imidazole-4-carboxamide isomerase [Melioribacteraceae bacterium]|nr:1-(5-phosphoribosyl)-5-[(5-phosphoribosylamino)methylideneamino]imidazole-4-carboxamide isomerase [Melioribacteraceae bacterium]
MLVIPAIDIIGGNVVRLSKGQYDSAVKYNNTPMEHAKIYDDYGFEWLHVVDLIGSRNGNINVLDIIAEIKNGTKLKVELGGGIRTLQDVQRLISAGVDRVVIGSMSVIDKPEFEKVAGNITSEKLVVASDVLNNEIRVKGWTEDSGINLEDHIKYCSDLGIDMFLVTDIDKDGLLSGPSFKLYEGLLSKFPEMKLIASGGISKIGELKELSHLNCYAAVIGKAIYENKINLEELKEIDNKENNTLS